MKPQISISEESFSLLYQAVGNGPNGYVILPPGKYYMTDIKQNHFFGTVWVSVRQFHWENSLEIKISDFRKFQKINSYA